MSVIDIASLEYIIQRPPNRQRDDNWPIKRGDPGRPMIPIVIGNHKLKAICDMGAGMNVIPLLVYDDILQFGKTCHHKKFGTVWININCPLNLNAFYGLIKISK